MKIVSFSASNFKKLTAVEITPDGNVVTLAGENGAGKSSILDGIEGTLAGKDSVCEKPIRDGANRAQTTTRLDNGFVITRTYTPGGSTLKITAGDETLRQPQAVLDKLIGDLTFDPLAFSRMKPAEQSETLRKLVGLDFSAIEREIKQKFDARTDINRQRDRDAARFSSMVVAPEGTPDLPTPMQDVLDAIRQAAGVNKAADVAVEALEHAKRNRESAAVSVQEALAQISQWQKVLAGRQVVLQRYVDAEVQYSDAAAKANFARVNTAELDARLLSLEASNAAVRAKQARKACVADMNAAADKSTAFTREIENLECQKADALRRAEFPLPGLSFDDGGVFFQGQPFAQISEGEKLRVSVAIGMALNPTLRLIFVRDGSQLDAKGLKMIASMAADKGYQVWIEDNRSTDPAAILIAEGKVVKSSSPAN